MMAACYNYRDVFHSCRTVRIYRAVFPFIVRVVEEIFMMTIITIIILRMMIMVNDNDNNNIDNYKNNDNNTFPPLLSMSAILMFLSL